MLDHLARVVVKDIRDGIALVLVAKKEVEIVGEALGKFILWPKQ